MAIDWDPVRPLEGAGDWLSGVEFHARAKHLVPEAIRPWLENAFEMPMRAKASTFTDETSRSHFVAALAQMISAQRRKNPAIVAWLHDEKRQRERREKCSMSSAALEAALSTFRLKLYP